jgi:hypothetical protein
MEENNCILQIAKDSYDRFYSGYDGNENRDLSKGS